jgi:hypothetical protein
MTALDDDTRKLFDAAIERHRQTAAIKRAVERDAKLIAPKVVGKQVVIRGDRYEIVSVDYSYDGTFRARGYRILGNGKRGSKQWDIGFICATHFDDAASPSLTA